MPQFYELNLDANGALIALNVDGVSPTPEAIALVKRFAGLFDQIQSRIPASPRRSLYADEILQYAKKALEQGDLTSGEEFLNNVNVELLSTRYYKAKIDANCDLHLSPMKWMEDPTPPAVQTFINRIENAIAKVVLLVSSGEKRERLIRTLESHARHGLEQGKLSDATVAVGNFEDRFVAELGPSIRKRHLVRTLSVAGVIIVIGLFLIVVSLRILPDLPDWIKPAVPAQEFVRAVATIAIGISLGVVFFAFMRNLALTFDTLGNFDPDQLSPWLRFTLVGVIAAILCILMSAGLIQLEVNGLALHKYATDLKAAVIVGILCGYSDAAITKLLTGVLDRKQ